MNKLLLLFFCIVAVNIMASKSTNIHCKYFVRNWPIVKNSYHCSVDQDPEITTRDAAIINSMSTNHQSGKTNSNIDAFHVFGKTFNYFPIGLDKFFKNLLVINIKNAKMKEVHQEDLKPFPELVELWLHSNAIEILEEGLLDFNPDLEYINFDSNKIVHIEPNIFDHLSKLSTLYLHLNTCINEGIGNSISEVKNIIQKVKSQCINSDFSFLKAQLENLERESKTLNSVVFTENLSTFKNSFKASKFHDFRPLNYKFDALLSFKISNVVLTKTLKMDRTLGSMSDLLTNVTADVNNLKTSSQISSNLTKDVKSSIDEFESTLNDIKSSICTKASLTQVLTNQQILVNAQNNQKSSLETSQKTQNELKLSIDQIKNEVMVLVDHLKVQQDDKLKSLSDKIEDVAEKLAQNKKELTSTRHKITIAIDEKIKGIENRLMKKFEEILGKLNAN